MFAGVLPSLSARRAWIETSTVIVIFRKRNTSLSARRAWIETQALRVPRAQWEVALRKESVDRNIIGSINRAIDISRSPQGERG